MRRQSLKPNNIHSKFAVDAIKHLQPQEAAEGVLSHHQLKPWSIGGPQH
jgi:hypothetical protein